ncbi:RtcB family protein [Enterococcus sp. AZ103]|uniref:RtcB family protein n=1 Tax=Enterococcus sp. AZ103 TaxID=2774628 RepID=UPI003F2029CC
MIIRGKYNTAKVFTENVENTAKLQINEMMNHDFVGGEQIRIMPDVHAGKGSTIGTTMTINNGKVVPNLVGVDIGCGISVYEVESTEDFNWEKLDKVINNYVPSGKNVRNSVLNANKINFNELSFPLHNENRVQLSQGTLGGGNHFIEISKSSDKNFLLIHSGSRNLGVQVAKYHQDKAIAYHKSNTFDRKELIEKLKAQGREREIESELAKIKPVAFNKELAYLEGDLLSDYFNDMRIAQNFAINNRSSMAQVIIEEMGWKCIDSFDSIHNYIDIENKILRKGATDARKDVRLVIPLNMRDGAIIAKGKGNPDWNYSAPHGAGRVMSRKRAKELVNLKDFKDSMKGIYSTSVVESTLDESPFAYKEAQEIVDNIHDTVEILDVIKPVYNFKAKE